MSSGLDRGLGFDFQVRATLRSAMLAEPSRAPAQEIPDSLFLCYTGFEHQSGRNGWAVTFPFDSGHILVHGTLKISG